MKLEMARFLKDEKQLLYYLAQVNVVPVRSPPWAEYPFELRRNQKMKTERIASPAMTSHIMEFLGIRDKRSCEEVRERIKSIRRQLGCK